MLTFIVGENSQGKSRYLKYLRSIVKGSRDLLEKSILDLPVDEASKQRLALDGDAFELRCYEDKEDVSSILSRLVRKTDLLLIDEIDSRLRVYEDACQLYYDIVEISRVRDVVAVTNDLQFIIQGDEFLEVNWNGETPVLTKVTLEEACEILGGK